MLQLERPPRKSGPRTRRPVQALGTRRAPPKSPSRAVSLPPAVVILSQLVAGALFGLIGLALATPLAAAAVVPLRHLYGTRKRDEPAAAEGTAKAVPAE